MSTRLLMTAEEFRELSPAEGDFELVRGELLEMNRPIVGHGLVCKNATFLLETWVRGGAGGFVLINDTGVITERDPDTVRGPDVAYVAEERMPPGAMGRWLDVAPDLVVEVRSPSDRWSDLLAKASEYHAAGVREVWILDPADRRLHRLATDLPPRQLTADDVIDGEPVLPGFRCDVAEFFRGL